MIVTDEVRCGEFLFSLGTFAPQIWGKLELERPAALLESERASTVVGESETESILSACGGGSGGKTPQLLNFSGLLHVYARKTVHHLPFDEVSNFYEFYIQYILFFSSNVFLRMIA